MVCVGAFAGILAANASYLNQQNNSSNNISKKSDDDYHLKCIKKYYRSTELKGLEVLEYIGELYEKYYNQSSILTEIKLKFNNQYLTNNIFDAKTYQRISKWKLPDCDGLNWSLWNRCFIIPQWASFNIHIDKYGINSIQKVNIDIANFKNHERIKHYEYILTLCHDIPWSNRHEDGFYHDYYILISKLDKNIDKLNVLINVEEKRYKRI